MIPSDNRPAPLRRNVANLFVAHFPVAFPVGNMKKNDVAEAA